MTLIGSLNRLACMRYLLRGDGCHPPFTRVAPGYASCRLSYCSTPQAVCQVCPAGFEPAFSHVRGERISRLSQRQIRLSCKIRTCGLLDPNQADSQTFPRTDILFVTQEDFPDRQPTEVSHDLRNPEYSKPMPCGTNHFPGDGRGLPASDSMFLRGVPRTRSPCLTAHAVFKAAPIPDRLRLHVRTPESMIPTPGGAIRLANGPRPRLVQCPYSRGGHPARCTAPRISTLWGCTLRPHLHQRGRESVMVSGAYCGERRT